MSIPASAPPATLADQRGCSSVGSSVSRRRLELRPISTILEAYLADLAARAGVPRPGILSTDSAVARLMDEQASKANARSEDTTSASPPSLPDVGY